jgi:hypothetical protein
MYSLRKPGFNDPELSSLNLDNCIATLGQGDKKPMIQLPV